MTSATALNPCLLVAATDEHSNSSCRSGESAASVFVRTLSSVLTQAASTSNNSSDAKGNLENGRLLLLAHQFDRFVSCPLCGVRHFVRQAAGLVWLLLESWLCSL